MGDMAGLLNASGEQIVAGKALTTVRMRIYAKPVFYVFLAEELYCREMRTPLVIGAVVFCCLAGLQEVSGRRDLAAYCGACKAVVDELSYEVDKVDPKKTIQTGSYRVDSSGKQSAKSRRYAGSETHMTELLETVCEKMRDYGTTTDPATGHRGYTRINTRPGESLTITNVNLSSGGSEELTNACHYVVGEHEEVIIDLYGDGLTQKEVENELCYEVTGYCAEYEHTEL